jgi:hypothetical protein
MIAIDEQLLDFVERRCREFQRRTGRTNVWLAVQLTNLSVIVYFIWAGAVIRIVGPRLRVAIVVFCVSLFWGVARTILRVPIESAEKSAYRRVSKGLRNPRRMRDAPLRLSFLALSILLLVPSVALLVRFGLQFAMLGYSLIVLTTIVLYLFACDPLPPCRGVARDWLRALRPAPAVVEIVPERS